MVKKAIALALVSVLVGNFRLPIAEAVHVTTATGTYNLTSTGVSKVAEASEKVRLGAQLMMGAGRWVGPVALAFAVFDVATGLWDWYRHYYSAPVGAPWAANSGHYYDWGRVNGSAITLYTYWVGPTPGSGCPNVGLKWSADPVSFNWSIVVGGYITWTAGMCGSPAIPYTAYSYVVYTQTGSGIQGATTSSVTMDRATAIADLVAYRDEVAAGAPVTLPQEVIDAVGTGRSTDPRQALISILNDAIDALNYGVAVSVPQDAGFGTNPSGQSGEVPAPVSGTGTGTTSAPKRSSTDMSSTNEKLDTLHDDLQASPDIPPGQQCPGCSKEQKWAEWWNTLKAAGQAAPVFALISRLAWPGSGSVQRQWTLGSWQGTVLSVDLDSSGIGTAITVVRFVVVGGAVIVAYMIIFA